MAAALPASLKNIEVAWAQGPTDFAQSQLARDNVGRSGDAHPLRAKALLLAATWRAAARRGGSGDVCRHGQQSSVAPPQLGDAIEGSAQPTCSAGVSTAQASAPLVAVETSFLRGMMSRSAPVVPLPTMQPLPAATVCRLLDNTAQFQVVIEFENLIPEDSTAAACLAGRTAGKGQPRGRSNATRKRSSVCVNQEEWGEEEVQRWCAVVVRPPLLTPLLWTPSSTVQLCLVYEATV